MPSLSILLRPFAAAYGAVLKVRHRLYDRGLKPSRPGPMPTVIVGNLDLGGTGKSPCCDYLIELLQADHSVALLSRGYGRQSAGYRELSAKSTAAEVGDEPLMLYVSNPGLIAAVCEDRLSGLEQLERNHAPDLVILDDAYQHRKLQGGFNIIVTRYDRPFWKNKLFPEGTLRDLPSRAKSADAVILSACPAELGLAEREQLRQEVAWYTAAPLFFTSRVYQELKPVFGKDLAQKKPSKLLVFSGIADDTAFVYYLSKHYEVVHVKRFRDHHRYSIADARKLKEIYSTFDAAETAIVTTAKDAVKLTVPRIHTELDELPIYYLPIAIQFVEPGFDEMITAYARANKRNSKLD